MADSESAVSSDQKTYPSRRYVGRGGSVRSRLSRRAQQPVKPVSVVHTVLCLTLFPYKGRPSLPPLLPLVFSEETIQRLLVTVCGRDTGEGVALGHVSSKTVFNGLDVLCWIASIASVDSERQDILILLLLLLFRFLQVVFQDYRCP